MCAKGHSVSIIGYEGTSLIPSLSDKSSSSKYNDPSGGTVEVIRLKIPSPEIFKKLLPIYLIWRILSLCIYLLYALFIQLSRSRNNARVDCLLVQNPPAMPLLAVAYFYCSVVGLLQRHRPRPDLIIDWHNLGFTMLSNPVFSNIAKKYERLMAPLADSHLCVTSAMKQYIRNNFAVPEKSVHVLCDCPPQIFKATSLEDQHELLSRLHGKITTGCPPSWYHNLDTKKQTLFTQHSGSGDFVSRPGRPALLVSSTSWTPDEDFGILLDSLVALDCNITTRQSSLKIVCLVTGKGPQKLFYEQKISKIKFDNVAIQTLWLEPQDYPRLLSCADLGISLHTSTSGIDLPMKILDLFGCQVPVCAKNFQCLGELVLDDENGRLFDTSTELADHLWYLLRPLGETKESMQPHAFGDLLRYSESLEGRTRWKENWKKNGLPAFPAVTSD